jgi:hypothetical protein
VPLKGFQCPSTAAEPGRKNEFSFCVNECPAPCQPKAVLSAIAQSNIHNVHKGDMLSATSLPGCPRKFLLTRTLDYYEEPRSLWDAGRGSLIHGVLETQNIEGVHVETRFYKVIDSGLWGRFVLSGQCDFYDPAMQQLEDFKSMEGDGLYTTLRYGVKDDHVLQLSVYAWLMDGGHVKPQGWTGDESPDAVETWPTVNWPVTGAKINYVTMRRVFSTGSTFTFDEKKDHKSPNGPNGGKKYPGEIKREKIPWVRGSYKWRITAKLPAIQLLSSAEVEQYVAMRGPNLIRGFAESDFMPPGVRDDNDRNWACLFCPVDDPCREYDNKQSGEQPSLLEDREEAA